MAAQNDTAGPNGATEAAVVPQDGNEAVESVSKATGEPGKDRKFISEFFIYFQLLVYANPTWLDITLLVTGTVSAAAAGVPFPLMGILFGQLVDDLNTASCDAQTPTADEASRIQSSIDSKVLELTYIGIASFVLIYVYIVCWSIFSRRLEARIRDRYFQALLQQDATFYDQRQAGELSSRLNADVQAVQSGTSEKVGICIACTSFFLTAYIVAFIKNWRLAVILLSLIPAFFLMAGLGSAFTAKYTSAMSDAIGSASSIAQETLSNIAVVQAFGAGPRLEAKFSSHVMTAQKRGIKKAFAAAVQAGTLYFIAYAANALSFWQGSHQIVNTIANPNGVSVGEIYTVIFLLVDACVIFGSVAPLLPLLGGASTAFIKLRQDIETPAAINSGSDSGLKLPDSAAASISFRNVSFAYVSRPDQPVLKNVSFDCPAGKYTAIVGLSGSGKSTVAGLTTRIYDPQDGKILLDGHDLKELNVKNLRSFISLVQQEPSLLDRSILENIALGLFNSPWQKYQKFQSIILGNELAEVAARVRDGQDLTTVAQSYSSDMAELVEMIRQSASLADASNFIHKLEYGYGTLVGTAGKLVSGGQRQRLAFARALIRDPKILLLDEATASLDSASEQRIQTAVESISKGRTIVAIAHRLSTIKNADNIIVMNSGEIIEQGTHFELMSLDGSYAGMVRLQNLASEEHDDTPSLSSTSKGDAEIILSEKESSLDEITLTALKEDLPAAASSNEQESSQKAAEGQDTALDPNQSTWKIIKSLGRMLRPHLLMLLLAAFSAVIVGGTFSSAGVIFGNTVEKVSPCNSTQQILWAGKFFGGLFFMLAVVELFAYTGSWFGFGYIAEKLLYKIRVLTFRSLYEQELDWHQSEGRSPASLLSIVTADTAAVGGFSGSIMGTMFSIVVNFFVAIILSHIIAWKIAIVCLVTVPILLGSGIMQVRSLSSFERKHAGAFSNALGITVEAVTSFKTVSSLSIEEEILQTYRRALKAPQKEMVLASVYTNFWLAIANSVGNLIYAFAYWWGSTRITKGEYSQAQFFIILMAMLVSAQLWGQMFTLAPEVSRSRAAASRILSLINLGSSKRLDVKEADIGNLSRGEKDIEAASSANSSREPKPSRGGATITFRDVSFAYPARPHIQILKDMSFTIPAGQFCGLVGPSGAGKSTIMSLVQRMYRPTGGAVEIDGVDICAREGVEFRHDIAVVPQDCALFDGTVKFNVGLGAVPGHEATDSEIEEACKLANIHDTIMALPKGYDTECGPNGSRLSGGQRQRLAIARALVRKPQLLLLDESTSALDAESEKALQEGLEQVARGITVIAITHRLHTVRKADVIFVVEGGIVVDKGRHEELVERSIVAICAEGSGLKSKSSARPLTSQRWDRVALRFHWHSEGLIEGLIEGFYANISVATRPHRNLRLSGRAQHSTTRQPVTIRSQERSGNPSSSVPVTDLTAPSGNDNTRSIGGRERGGSVQLSAKSDLSPVGSPIPTPALTPPVRPKDSDNTYELADYKDIAERKTIQDRERRQQEKRALKRYWLETQDEMKFSHSIQFNAVPDWSSHYIAYSNLKKLIYQLEKSAHQARAGDAESRPLISAEEPEEAFSKSLGVELEKICSFYSLKEGELLEEVSQLLHDVGEGPSLEASATLRPTPSETHSAHTRTTSLHSHGSDDDDSATDDDETTGLTRHRGKHGRRKTVASIPDMTASSEFGRSRRYSTTIDDYGDQSFLFGSTLYSSGIMLKKRIIALYVQLCELKSYAQLNKTGFSKVLKKFDKILDKELRSSYISTYVDTAYPFKSDTKKLLDENVAKMEVAYADVVTAGDEELAKKDLRSHLREHVVWERNTVWRDLIGIERRGEAARFGQTLLGQDSGIAPKRLQGDDEAGPAETQIKTPMGRIILPSWLSNTSVLTLVISVVSFLLLLFIPILENPEQQNCLALLVFVSLMWATETIPLFVTSLLIPFLAVVLRVVREEDPGKPPKRLTSKEATAAIFSAMWSPVIMLLLGGFTLAAALSKCKIDKRLATLILSKAGTQPRTVLIANMFVAAFASMLISNVAAPVLCFSIIEPMLRTLPSDSNMSKAVIIGIALASNIGGMLSPIASPQNVVAMGIMKPEPTWLQWFFIVIPVGVVSIFLIWLLLLVTFQPGKGTSIAPIRPLKEKFTGGQWFVSIVTIITIVLWCTSHTLESVFGDMGVVAIIPIVLFFGIGILTKEDFNNFPWTIIILAAGGLSLGKAVRSSGLLHTLAEIVSREVEGMSLYGVLVVFSSLILVIATFISHTVAALIFLPLVYDVGVAMDQPHPNLLVMGGVLMCSAAMGLPTSGFPNMTAIMKEDATGRRYLSVKHFISRGVPSSLITLVVVATLGYGIMEVAGLD